MEEPVEDPGSTCQWEMWAGGAGFSFFYGCGKTSAVEDEVDAGSKVSEWEPGALGAGRRAEGGGATAVPTHALFHGICS